MPEEKKAKKYYWLKLKRDFFKRHDIQIIEAMPNGKDYILFYLKLLCESVDHEGNLRFSEHVPYNEDMLSVITRTNVDIVRSAIKVFGQLGMIEILDDGTYFMSEVQKMIGSESEWAEKKRLYRENQKLLNDARQTQMDPDKKLNTGQTEDNVQTMSDKSIEIEIEKEKELETDIYAAPQIPYKEIVDYLNDRTGAHYKATTQKTRDLIKARFNQGFTKEDFFVVIDKKTAEWINDPQYAKFLRPETLFGTKFEGYLNQIVRQKKKTLNDIDVGSMADFMNFEEAI